MEDLLVTRKILHLDLDAFFCAVEELHDPSLKGKPFAVGGSPQGRGVVASCSYAARRFGIRSAMPMARALRLCPELQIVRHSFSGYSELSRQVMDILRAASPHIQPISIDEAFIDLTHLEASGEHYARELQKQIQDELGLPSSLGVATNKLVAKTATNVGKASHKGNDYPRAIQVVPPGEEAAFLAPLPTEALWGVGTKTAEKLARLGIKTIEDITNYPYEELSRRFGKHGRALHLRAQGIDTSPVRVDRETKSVSHEVTYREDTNNEAQLRETIQRHSRSISKRLKKLELVGTTIKIKIRWPDFTTFSRQVTMQDPTDNVQQIEFAALQLFFDHWKPGRKVRLLGVGVSGLEPPSRQLSLWDWDPTEFDKKQRLDAALDTLQKRYGARAVQPASKLQAEK